MWDAAVSIRDAMLDLGVACDGGKDSLSMAASADGEIVMAPGNLVVSAYVGCPDITQVSSKMRVLIGIICIIGIVSITASVVKCRFLLALLVLLVLLVLLLV